ncbi:helix-turn-helix domain-containing protein [Lysinibacillus sp. 3P01SB]|uniref:helix-turn-helix domain-containing protein n=1 Tax=Lysinibacillus sp. 3P01SB TaxID=3132284 RepID=UPI0039A5A966
MNLQQLLKTLRAEESVPTAAKRIGISAGYLRNLERGYDPQRSNKPLNPSPITLNKIAEAYKVDYQMIAEAAGIEVKAEQNEFIPFHDEPLIHHWYTNLPSEDIQEVKKLYGIWKLMKGENLDVF